MVEKSKYTLFVRLYPWEIIFIASTENYSILMITFLRVSQTHFRSDSILVKFSWGISGRFSCQLPSQINLALKKLPLS